MTLGKIVRDASVAFQQKNYDECLNIISHADHHDDTTSSEKVEMNIKIGTMMGLCHYNRAVVHKDQASELFGKALKEFDKVISSYKEYEGAGNNMKDIVITTNGLEVVITTTKVNYLAGLCLLHTNRYKEAIPYFNTCALMASNLQSNIGNVADKNLAKSFLKDSVKCYLNRGICYNECQSNELAEKDLLRFISLVETSEMMTQQEQQPLLFLAFTSLANTKLNKNQQEESIKYFNRAIDTFNSMDNELQHFYFENFVKAKLKRATTLQKYINYNVYSCKNDENLLKVLEKYREMVSDDIKVAKKHKDLSFYHLYQYVKMILVFCKHLEGIIEKDNLVLLYQDAVSNLEECISIQPSNAKLYGDLALCKSKIGEEAFENVLDLYNKSFDLTKGEPTDKVSRQRLAKIYFERSVIHYKLSDTEKCRQDLDKAIHFNPYFSDAYYNRGFLLKDSEDDIEQALDDLGATCELNLEDTECALLTAVMLVKQGNKEGAQLIVEEFIKFNANDTTLKDLLSAINNDESMESFESLPTFRESHKKTKMWIPKRKSQPTQDRAARQNDFTQADLTEEDEIDDYFCDPNFPAVSKSIYGTGQSDLAADLTWYRAWDLCFLREEATLYVDGSSNTDIMQGGIGDCWLLASFSIVADYPELMQKIILEEKSDPDNGKYTFSLYGEEGPTEVVIDNRLPCYSDGSLAFSRSGTNYEMWVCLLEKAFASFYGSYQALQLGYLREGLVTLTGGVPFTLEVTLENKELVWETISNVKKKSTDSTSHCLMGCRTDKPVGRTGIQTHHAYGILDCFDCPLELTNGKRTRLIKIRNPWGYGGEPQKGDYSDDSKWWNDELREYVGHQTGIVDGIFFQSLGAFIKTWSQIHGVRLYDSNEWSEVSFVDQLKQQPKESEDWTLDLCSYSSQYVIHNTHEDNDVKIVISQKDVRFSQDQKDEYKSIAIYVYKYAENQFNGQDSPRLTKLSEENENIHQGVYTGCYREVVEETSLSIGHFVVIPHAFYSDIKPDKFNFRIISRKPLSVFRLPVQ